MRVPEKFWEAHADGFESATGGDDDADGHGGGGLFFCAVGWTRVVGCGRHGLAGPGVGLAVTGE